MGIENIHILINPGTVGAAMPPELKVRLTQEQMLVEDHRRGAHPWGEKRRDCPLCQLGN